MRTEQRGAQRCGYIECDCIGRYATIHTQVTIRRPSVLLFAIFLGPTKRYTCLPPLVRPALTVPTHTSSHAPAMSATVFASLVVAPACASVRRHGRSSPARANRGPRPSRATYGPIGEAIASKISESLAPEMLVVNDDSEKHANHKGLHDGHAGVRSNESHFNVTVVSGKFDGMPQVKRHRMVNAILQKEFDDGLHALQLSTKTPAEWEKTNAK